MGKIRELPSAFIQRTSFMGGDDDKSKMGPQGPIDKAQVIVIVVIAKTKSIFNSRNVMA
jgi:hypothetical protein